MSTTMVPNLESWAIVIDPFPDEYHGTFIGTWLGAAVPVAKFYSNPWCLASLLGT